jgi:hypothetical protein
VTSIAGRVGPWLVVGVVGWIGVAWLGILLWNQEPPRAGFDLTLLLEAGRSILAGDSPYDPMMLAGGSPEATGLFYSYPPPVAQAMTPLAGLPDGVVLVLWGIGAIAGLALVAGLLARTSGRDGSSTALRAIAVAPLVLPFAVALLFGNFDVWYPLAYGALVLAVLPGASRRTLVVAGVSVAIVSIAKLHPAALLVWVVARAIANRGGPAARVLGAAAVAGIGIVLVSVAVWRTAPWLDYLVVLQAGAGAELVDPRNLGPVSLLGQAVALDAGTLRLVQVGVTGIAVIASVIAAARLRDPLASLSVAIVASMVMLPVTWYHYPVALIPIGVALATRAPRSRPHLVLAVLLADLAIAFGPLLWVAVAVLVLAAFEAGRSAGRPSPAAQVLAP